MRITKTFEFSMGHALWNYDGKCHNLHGHNYNLEITVQAATLDESGFVMDFGDLKKVVSDIVDTELDHRTLVYENDPRFAKLVVRLPGLRTFPWEPTAENLVAYLGLEIAPGLPEGITLAHIKLWETNTSYAEMSFLTQ